MDAIVITPKNKEEFRFFLELAKRLGVKAKSFEDLQDEQLLLAMEENRKTQIIDKESVMKTLQDILNEPEGGYKK
jgi:MoaA/NifB/PqqE/SkfB family radical SAM enzyme